MSILKIQGFDWEVIEVGSAETLGSFGKCNFRLQRIEIANDLNPQKRTSTILHEMLEAVKEYKKCKLCHDDMDRLEVGIFEALTGNGVDLSKLGE